MMLGFCSLSTLALSLSKPNVLVVYARDLFGQTKDLAAAIAEGAALVTPTNNIRVRVDTNATYAVDVKGWGADAVILGSGVYDGNAAPSMFEFINTFDFTADLSKVVGGSFATASGPAAGLQPTLAQLNRGLQTFRIVTVGGASWENGQGTGVVTNGSEPIVNGSAGWVLAVGQGERITRFAKLVKVSHIFFLVRLTKFFTNLSFIYDSS